MKLEDQVVSLELAKKLKELGVRQESAFYWAETFDDVEKFKLFSDGKIDKRAREYAAFTVAELGEMLPFEVPGHQQLQIRKYPTDKIWWCGYYSEGVKGLFESSCYGFEAEDDSIADVLAKMLIHLIEKGVVKV